MNLNLITAPVTEPVVVEELRDHLHITSTAQDKLLYTLLKSARIQCENFLRRRLMTQTWDVYYDAFDDVELPYPPLQSVTSVKYVDNDGTTQTVNSSLYTVVSATNQPGQVTLAYNQSWPSDKRAYDNSVVIRFVCGYGDNYTDVPEDIRLGILAFAAELYQHPAASTDQRLMDVPLTPFRLWKPYQVAL